MKRFFIPAVAAMCAALTFTACESKKTTDDDEEDADEMVVVEEETPEVAETAAPSWMPDSAVVTPSGLGIVIYEPGSDVKAGPRSMVKVHYRGRLTDGTVFDSSYDRGEPAVFPVGGVIPGFGEGIMMIGVGGKATLYIPGNLAYGPRGVPEAGIGPDENLIFDIEVLGVE